MSNNKQCEIYRNQINDLEAKIKYSDDDDTKLELYKNLLTLRKTYTSLLMKKRKMLLTLGIVFAIFYGISLTICLPPYIIRGKKRDINEDKIKQIEREIIHLENKVYEKASPLD